MTETRVVLVTAPDGPAASGLCRALLDEGLIACGNVLSGVTSVYRWEGRVHEDPESLVILKTHASRVEQLLRRIPELHSYDVPEVLVLDVSRGHEPYLNWVGRETGPQE